MVSFVSDAAHPGRSVLELSIALSDNPRTRPIIEGRVIPGMATTSYSSFTTPSIRST